MKRLIIKYPHMAQPKNDSDAAPATTEQAFTSQPAYNSANRQGRPPARERPPSNRFAPRAASASEQDVLYYGAAAPDQSAPPQFQQDQEGNQYVLYTPQIQQLQLQHQQQTPPQPVYSQPELLPAPPPASLDSRSRTPTRDAAYHDQLRVASTPKKGTRLPGIDLKIWPETVNGAANLSKPKHQKTIPDTGCTSPMCTPEFAKKHSLYVKPITTEQAAKFAVQMGNSTTSKPLGTTHLWMAVKGMEKNVRRKVFVLILKDLPEEFLIGMLELKKLGLLPLEWPDVTPKDLTPAELKTLEDSFKHPLDEDERTTNALLYAEGIAPDGEDLLEDTLDDEDDIGSIGYASARCTIPDSHFEIDTCVNQVPGYADGLDREVKQVLDDFPEVFQKKLDRNMHTAFKPARFELKKNFDPPPRAKGCRPVPQHWRGEFDKMLDSMIEQGQIAQVLPGDPISPFLSAAFLVNKPNDPTKPRMVIDYSKLKDLFIRNPFPQRDPLTIFGRLREGCRNFFVADMSSGYFQVRLEDGPNGSDVTTFVCDRGVFKFLVMPMGIHPASDVLSQQMEAIFAELFRSVDGSAAAGARLVRDLDDFLYGSPTKAEMLKDLRRFLTLCRDNGVYLNPSKFRVAVDDGKPDTSVIFAGIKVCQDGTYQVDPDRLESIRNFPKPTTKKELQRWLGLCTSLGTFAPTQLHMQLPLQRELQRVTTNGRLRWTPQIEEEFYAARETLSQPSILHPFDPKLQTAILTDVAKTVGIGIILFQYDPKLEIHAHKNFKLMGVWSVTAKPAWKDLSPLETEIVGFYQAVQKLHYYIYGAREIHGFVDHQPFPQAYHNKDMSELSPRMLKLMEELLELPFKMKYLPNKSEFIMAVDALSRAPTRPSSDLFADPLDSQFHPDNRPTNGLSHHEALLYTSNTATSEWYAEDPTLEPLFDAAEKDELYMQICNAIEESHLGFSKLKDTPATTPASEWLHKHKKQWGAMGILRNGRGQRLLWLDGQQVIPPEASRERILQIVDSVHNGPARASNLAKRSYWWPNMNEDIDFHCEMCEACPRTKDRGKKEVSIATPVPPAVGHTMGADFAEVPTKSGTKTKYLILTDYLSGYSVFFHFLAPPTTLSLSNTLGNWWHLNGWPTILACDGEGILTSAEFGKFLKNNGIAHRRSSVDHPQSNGLAEASVKTFKRLWEKCNAVDDEFYSAWSFWMDTPREPGELSPTRMWFGRPVRHPSWWSPPERDPVDTLVASQEAYIRRKETSKAYNPNNPAFSHAPSHPHLSIGTHVLVRDKDTKQYDIPAVVMAVSDTGRGARVRRTDTGAFMLRNRKGMKLDPKFLTPIIITSPTSRASTIMRRREVQSQKEHKATRVSFADRASVASFETHGWVDELGKTRRIGIGGVTPEEPIPTFHQDFDPDSFGRETQIPPPPLPEPALGEPGTGESSVGPPSADTQPSEGDTSPVPPAPPRPEDVFFPSFLTTPTDVPSDVHQALPGHGGHSDSDDALLGPDGLHPQTEAPPTHAPPPGLRAPPEDSSSDAGEGEVDTPGQASTPHQHRLQGGDDPGKRLESDSRGAPVLGDQHRLDHDEEQGRQDSQRALLPSVDHPHPPHSNSSGNVRWPPLPPQHPQVRPPSGPAAQPRPGRPGTAKPPPSFTWSSTLFRQPDPGQTPRPHKTIPPLFGTTCSSRRLPPGAGHHAARFPGVNAGNSAACRRGPRGPAPTFCSDGPAPLLQPILRGVPQPCSTSQPPSHPESNYPVETAGNSSASGEGARRELRPRASLCRPSRYTASPSGPRPARLPRRRPQPKQHQ